MEEILAFLIFVLIVWFIVLYKKKKKIGKKRWLILATIFVLYLVVGTIHDNTSDKQSSANRPTTHKVHKTKHKVHKDATNKLLAEQLKMDKGWADGTIDSKGNPTTNGTPNSAFNWAKYVDSFKWKGYQLTINLNENGANLGGAPLDNYAKQAQNAAFALLCEENKISSDEANTGKGIVTYVKYKGKIVGISSAKNRKKFSWNF